MMMGNIVIKENPSRIRQTEKIADIKGLSRLCAVEGVEDANKWPIVYAQQYNISFHKLENLHPFDSKKWGRVIEMLIASKMLNGNSVVAPVEIEDEELMVVHTKSYIQSLKSSYTVARITEIPPVALLPNSTIQRRVLTPFRYQTSGTILAGKLALNRGWAINVGGGFHHCSSNVGGGFCAYADVTLCIKNVLENESDRVKRVTIVDLDAHQGNGHERDFMQDSRVYIMDVYNRHIYPQDIHAKAAIRRNVELSSGVKDGEYLNKVKSNLASALEEFVPDFIFYNAGTDILKGDRLGLLSVTSEGIIQRDELVFSMANKRNIPIVMVTSGGYQKETARVIADSILNLRAKGLIYK